jgi:uncharacterized protein (TIGR02246 family)
MMSTTAGDERGELDSAIRRLHEELLDAWNRRDAGAFARLFTADGSVVGFDGTPVDGARAIEGHLSGVFADHTPARFVAVVREVRWLGPGAALLRAVAGMVPHGARQVNADVNAVQSVVATMDQGGWRVALFQNTPAAFHGRPGAAEALTAELQQRVDNMNAW